jgi:hypothetical protein
MRYFRTLAKAALTKEIANLPHAAGCEEAAVKLNIDVDSMKYDGRDLQHHIANAGPIVK